MAKPPLSPPSDWLDVDLTTLDFARDRFAPLIWRDALGLAGLAFSDAELAAAQLARLRRASGAEGAPGSAAASAPRRGPLPRLQTLRAGDLRARQEWLEAVLHAGAARVLFDLNVAGEARGSGLSAALLADVLSRKRGLACL